ncbi:large conductance mechanosensitive channel protein MscL [Acidicapsa ligni]|uniref:large conductance mechanosensitive channel protein MscL n=1 Tax=Acidicapsa ligni TaxID=542300 RepID=UPI0021DF43FF|nr:large conductance mechanosensitive channel protein MscL [Acidicapsa ligni]
MLKGFRDFILRGNVVDLAVAVILGAAFNAIVGSLVANILNPLLAALVGKPDFSYLILEVHGGKVQYGLFLNAVINFLLVASAVYFGVVLPINKFTARLQALKGPAPVAAPTTKACPECLSEIPLAARRCSHCGQPVA